MKKVVASFVAANFMFTTVAGAQVFAQDEVLVPPTITESVGENLLVPPQGENALDLDNLIEQTKKKINEDAALSVEEKRTLLDKLKDFKNSEAFETIKSVGETAGSVFYKIGDKSLSVLDWCGGKAIGAVKWTCDHLNLWTLAGLLVTLPIWVAYKLKNIPVLDKLIPALNSPYASASIRSSLIEKLTKGSTLWPTVESWSAIATEFDDSTSSEDKANAILDVVADGAKDLVVSGAIKATSYPIDAIGGALTVGTILGGGGKWIWDKTIGKLFAGSAGAAAAAAVDGIDIDLLAKKLAAEIEKKNHLPNWAKKLGILALIAKAVHFLYICGKWVYEKLTSTKS